MAGRPVVRLKHAPSGASGVVALAAQGGWRELPAEPSLNDLRGIAYTLDGYALADEYFGRDPSDVAAHLVARHEASGIWGGTTLELLVALFGAVRSWSGPLAAPSPAQHHALAIFGALRARLEAFPNEVDFVPESKARVQVRTSASHPLQIGWVDAPPGWRIGITIAPGKTATSTEGFRWARVLGDDLGLLVEQRVGTLVCLLETDEMARLGVPDLAVAARKRGLDVIHTPIVDVSVPSMDDARALIAKLLTKADASIVIHCNGGLGRSGVVAGCLLRALGVSAETALSRLQAARGPRCPETAEQRDFIERFSYPLRARRTE